MSPLQNPILPGFNPDPSILRVISTYYIATSTFEWYPGIQIFKSDDLANWTLITRPLSRTSQLDLRGVPDSCGVWAPCLSYGGDKDKRFWLAYTVVKRKGGAFGDTHNYVITAEDIEGPWSDPTYVNSLGFDPSIFHDEDDDGKPRVWFLNMLWNHRVQGKGQFAGIALQEFDTESEKLVGERKTIFKGTELGRVEGPHLYKRKGWYYLLTAEGGTGYDHACTLARSRDIWGPYELHPDQQILTSRHSPFAALQRAGHGDLVDTPDGRTYLVHLAARPVGQSRRCVLGRETAIQEVFWDQDDWLYIKNGFVPSLEVDVPAKPDDQRYWEEVHYTFEGPDLHKDFQWLRTPDLGRIARIQNRRLCLIGRESIGSWFEQSLIARRQTHFSYEAETAMNFSPTNERQFAGLTAYYSRFNFFYLAVTADSDGNRELMVLSSEGSWPHGKLERTGAEKHVVQIPPTGKVRLMLCIRGGELQFSYAFQNDEAKTFGPQFDATILSDECAAPGVGGFTGAFVGLACSDLDGTALQAQFDHFVYRPVRDKLDRYEI